MDSLASIGSTRLRSATPHPPAYGGQGNNLPPTPTPTPKCSSGKRLAFSGLYKKKEKGNRRPDEWLGCPFSGLRSRPSGARNESSGSGNLSSVIDSVISTSGGWWQPQVAGGGHSNSIRPSIQSSMQSFIRSSVVNAALCHLSSMQPSTPSSPLQVAGGSPRWRVAGLFHSDLHSALYSVLHSVLRHRLSHRTGAARS